jgi:hypothetical protein
MRNSYTFFIFLLSMVSIGCKFHDSSSLILDTGWRFKIGDNVQWASPNLDDSKWDTSNVGHSSAGLAFNNYTGYGWYRVKFDLPQNLRDNNVAENIDSINFYFGAIDDCDEVYLNGSLIGANNQNFPDGSKSNPNFINPKDLWSIPRKYVLSAKDGRLRWDTKNVIAIRVFNQNGGGGIYSDIPTISRYGLADYLDIDLNNYYKVKDNEYVSRDIILSNKSMRLPINGEMEITARNTENGSMVYQQQYDIILKPGEIKSLFVKLPVSTDPIKLDIKVRDHNFNQTLSLTDSIPYILIP